jgi:hypothetical protein
LCLATDRRTDNCSSDKTVNIQNSGDAATIGQCTKYKGNVAVDSKMTDDITWDKIEELDGDFLIKGVQGLKRVAAPKLKTITGKLEVNDASQLAALGFDALTEVKELTLLGLANLRSLTFSKKISKCDKLRVENTKLESLMGIDLMTASSIVIANNPMIANISMQTTNITGPLDLSFNNADVIVSFPNLEQARNISMRAVGNLSLPALSTVDPGSFGIFSSKIKSFYAQNLTEIKEAVTIVNCDNLTDISFASLTKVGASFLITNNTALGNVTQLPKLEEVGAALDISGNLTKSVIPIMPPFASLILTKLGSKPRRFNTSGVSSTCSPPPISETLATSTTTSSPRRRFRPKSTSVKANWRKPVPRVAPATPRTEAATRRTRAPLSTCRSSPLVLLFSPLFFSSRVFQDLCFFWKSTV